MEVSASAKFQRFSPRKARLVTDLITGKSAEEAISMLENLPKGAALPIGRVVRSAVANAENNFNMTLETLYVKRAIADEGLPRHPDGKLHLVRTHGRFEADGRWHVRSTGEQGSHQLASTAAADGPISLPVRSNCAGSCGASQGANTAQTTNSSSSVTPKAASGCLLTTLITPVVSSTFSTPKSYIASPFRGLGPTLPTM